MKKYKLKSVPSKHGAFIRGRIDKSRRRAETVGLIYLFSMIALIAVTCFGLLTSEYAAVTVKDAFVTVKDHDFGTVGAILKFSTAVLYLLTLLVPGICALNALTHLKNLFKKKVSRVYGLNANIDAMDSMGHMFSSAFACILINHLLVYALCGETAQLTMFGYVLLGLGFGIHFICGFSGGKVSVFYIDDEKGVSESKRPYGRLMPLFRNVLQFAAIVAIGYLFLQNNSVHDALLVFIGGGSDKLTAAGIGLVPVLLEVLVIIWLIGLIAHSVGTAEYSVEGPYATGIRNFRVFSCLLFLTSAASAASTYFLGKATFTLNEGVFSHTIEKSLDQFTLIIAGVSLVMYLLDFALKLRWTRDAIAESERENKPIIPNINVTTPKQPINIQVPELKVPELTVHMPAPKAAELPPINIHMPAAQKQVAPAPINVNMPSAQKQVAPAPISVMMPNAQAQVAPAPINVMMPNAQAKVAPAPINVMMPTAMPQQERPLHIAVPMPRPQQTAPINVLVPAIQQEPTPVNVILPEIKQEKPEVNVILPEIKQETPEVNVVLPELKQETPEVNVVIPELKQETPEVNVMVPQMGEPAPTPVNIYMPNAQDQVEAAPINLMVPNGKKKGKDTFDQVAMQNGMVRVDVGKDNTSSVNVYMSNAPVATSTEPMPMDAAMMGTRMEGIYEDPVMNPMMMPMMPPLMTMNPMMQPYPMHMNMPMVDPLLDVDPEMVMPIPNKAEIKDELRNELKEELRAQLKEELRAQLREELLQEMQVDPEFEKLQREELKREIRKELRATPEQDAERREALKKEIKDELREDPEKETLKREALKREIRDEMMPTPEQVAANRQALKDEIRKEMVPTPEQVAANRQALKDEIRKEMMPTPEQAAANRQALKDEIRKEMVPTPEQAAANRQALKDEIRKEMIPTPEQVEANRQALKDEIRKEMTPSPEEIAANRQALKDEIREEMKPTPEEEAAQREALKSELKDELKKEMEEKPQDDAVSGIVDAAGDKDVNITPIVLAGGTSTNEQPVEEEKEEVEDTISSKQWEIKCPTCSKRVKTKAGSLYHRCPFCQNVFELQKQVMMVQNEESQETSETETSAESNENNE